MIQRTAIQRSFGTVLYPSASSLPVDFFHCCKSIFGITVHQNVFIGTRSSQQRGLFLSQEDRKEPLPANTPIATIPLSSLYTVNNIHQKLNTMHDVTVERVRDAIPNEEFKIMAPQLYMGLQFASIIHMLPDVQRAENVEATRQAFEVLRGGANPWARMLDDEDFNESFVFGMYGMTLDTWQRSNYEDMTRKFHVCTSAIHEAIHPNFGLDHFRRIARLVLARLEHLPPADYYDGSRYMRLLQRRLRHLRGVAEPSELAMVPLLDLINHSNRPNCGVRIGPSAELGGKGALTLFSLGQIQPGQEICRHYNFALKRDAALFRYGFLPFDLICIVEQDSAKENYFNNAHMLRPKSEEVLQREKAVDEEVARLQRIFSEAKKHGPRASADAATHPSQRTQSPAGTG